MAFGTQKTFKENPFATAEAPTLVKPLPPVETHELPRPRRSYLAPADLSGQLTSALSPLLPGAPRPTKHIPVERIRYVDRAPEVPEAPEAPEAGR